MESINTNEMFRKMNEINVAINNGCDLQYLEENMNFVFEVGKFYNNYCGSLSVSKEIATQIRQCYQFFSWYLLAYMAKKYDKHFGYQLESDTPVSHFFQNSINLSKKMIGITDFEHIMFTIFHEFRHKMQHDDINNIHTNVDSILSTDPSAIILLKEKVTQVDSQLYSANHDCFIMEHDANLFALSECSLFIDKKKLEQDYRDLGETNNYINAMITGTDLSSEEFHDKQHLPIVYEQDYRYKKFILGKQIPSNSMLSLIYNPNGTPKTYQELLEEKKKLIEKYKGQVVDRKTSTTNYEQWSNSKRAEEHIEEIFKLIIASDPILTLQENLYKFNKINNKLIAKQYSDRVAILLNNCPQLVDIYSKEITSMLRGEILNGNVELVQGIIHNFPTTEVAKEIQSIITVMNMNVGGKKAPTTGSEEYEERTQEEQQIATGQKKTSKFRPIISEAVKKSVILRDEKQKLHEMKEQLLDYQEQQSRNQEAEYEEEESHGMSM